MDRNTGSVQVSGAPSRSLSARRAWIEMFSVREVFANFDVALRKESVDRNGILLIPITGFLVALRKESVDRNSSPNTSIIILDVALRKESVDRN